MKRNAIRLAKRTNEAVEQGRSAVQLQKHFGACALAYILDDTQQETHARRVYEHIVGSLAKIQFDESEGWAGVVPPMGAAFVGIIALDVVYDDLTADQIQRCEDTISTQIGKIDRRGSWPNGRRGTHGTWDVYIGRRTAPDDAFYKRYLEQISIDGVATTASSYAWTRLGSSDSRPQKTGYADVLEFTGVDNRYYDHPRLKRFYRWLFGSAVTPAKQLHVFGDYFAFNRYPLGPNQREQLEVAALLYRAGRFGEQAGRYAAWALEDREPPGHILAYVPKQTAHEPKVPTSELYAAGGAFFREPTDSPDALGAMLYNITERAEWHAHQETNALSFTAYGSRMLVNGGWLGPPTRPARRNNTLTVNKRPHETRTGAGLEEGLTGNGIDYAAGHSGEALPGNAWFTRSLVLVHGRDGANGYVLTMDDVQARRGDTVYHSLHPATGTKPEEVVPGAEFEATINRFNTVEGNRLSVFYARAPQQVTRMLLPTGSGRADAPRHYRLETQYPTNYNGEARLITVLFPHNDEHKKPAFTRHSADGVTGVSLSHDGNVVDSVYESAGRSLRKGAEGARFRGRMVLFREARDELAFYFVRRGTNFSRGQLGFSADERITLYMRGMRGRYSATEETLITFYHPDVSAVRHAGMHLEAQESGSGWIRVIVPPGTNRSLALLQEE